MKSLRSRLIVAYLGALLPALVALLVIAFFVARAGLDAELARSLQTAARIVAGPYDETPAGGRLARLEVDSVRVRERIDTELRAARDEGQLRRIRIISPTFENLVDTDATTPGSPAFDLEPDRHEIDAVLAGAASQASVLFRDADGTPFKRAYAPIHHEGAVVAVLAVEGDARHVDALFAYAVALLIGGLAALGVTIAVTVLIAGRIARPLTALSSSARTIGAGDLRSPVTTVGDDEIAQLAVTLEQMRRDLLARDEERQMMLAGVAHEVRNPLGGIELFAGLLAEELEGDPRSEHVGRIRDELAYLRRTVEDFLAWARERESDVRLFSATALARAVCDSVAGLAHERGVLLDIDCDEGLELSGDREALRGVVHNLVQNAIQASQAGSRVVVRFTASGAGRRVDVVDHGAGMDESALANAFRPFWTTREKGTGLGLPLARRIVSRHGGTLTLESRPGVGTTATMVLPFVADAPPCDDGTVAHALSDDMEDCEMIG